MNEGYKIGQRPPKLRNDGSFETPMGVRAYSLVSEEGQILSVNQNTGLLMGEEEAKDEMLLDIHRSIRR